MKIEVTYQDVDYLIMNNPDTKTFKNRLQLLVDTKIKEAEDEDSD